MATESLTDALRETLALFDGSGAPQTTTEVAERLGLGRRSTYDRLDRLVAHGRLETKKVGAAARVWWRPRSSTSAERPTRSPDWPAAAESLIDDVLDRAEVGVFVLDENFDVAWLNDATVRYFGLDRERVLGRDKRQLVDERIAMAIDDAASFAETVLATYDDNTYTEQFECHVTSGEGRQERWLEHRSKPIESGAYAGGRVELYYDVTGRKRPDGAHQSDRAQLESLVDAVEEYAIFMLDPDGYVRTWNPGVERIKGYEAEEIVGEHFSTFYTDDDRAACVPEENLEKAAAEESIEDEGWRVRKDGSRFWADVTLTAVRAEDGDLEGYAKVTRDTTERREYEQRLAEQAERLERQRYDLERELDDVFERVDDAFYALDDEFRFEYVNDSAETYFGTSERELLGRNIWVAFDVDEDDPLIDQFERAMATQEPTSIERYSDPLGIWVSARVYPSASGLSVYFTDISGRKRRERELEESERRYRTLVDNFPNGIVTLFDEDLRYLVAGGELYEAFDGPPDETIGKTLYERSPPEEIQILEPHYEAALDGKSHSFEVERGGRTIQFWTVPVPDETGNVFAGMAMSQDVTERKRRERELEEYRRWNQTLVENFPAGGVALVDEEFQYVTFGGTPVGGADVTREELEGANVREVLPQEIADVVVPRYEAALDGEPSEFQETIDDRVCQFHFVPVRDDDGDVFAATAMSQDITGQKEREQKLREAKLQLEAATEAGAVGTWEWRIPEDEFVAGPSFARTFGVDPDAAREGVSFDRFVSAIHEDDRDRVERRVDAAVSSCGEYEAEYRVRHADGEFRWIVARGHVECDDDGNPVTFPGALIDITERKRAERELERQREELAALNNLNEVFQDITDAVIEQSTRDEIEAAVCEGLAAAESFSFAWIGDVNPATQMLNLRTEAGVEGYFDAGIISVDPADERSQGPGGQAFLTREVHVTRDVQIDEGFEPWRDRAAAHDIRSTAGIPIVHDDRVYGVLGVYAERPDAFAEAEQRVFGQLGELVGHAIAAVEHKRALMSDEVIEIEFHIDDVFAAVGMDASFGGRITLDQAVPASDEEFLVYGNATEEAWPALDELVDAVSHWKAISELGAALEGPRRFELRLSEPPVLSAVASRGGYVETARIEDGDYSMAIHLPPTGNVRAVREAVADAYPTAELLAQRQLSRTGEAVTEIDRLIHEELTDRQRQALEAAFYAGFFEWPREATGDDVADSLGVSPPTFHQHLRKAERKVVQSMLSTVAPS